MRLGRAPLYPRSVFISIFALLVIAGALTVMQHVRAADQPIDLDQNGANGQESKVSTKVLTTYPVKVENTVVNNSPGTAYIFKWPGAGPGGFNSYVTAGPGVGTKWVWSTVYQVYSIDSPVEFTPARALPVFGSRSGGVEPIGSATPGQFTVAGKSIYPSQVTLSDASLSSSLITFFSPEKTIATCGFDCAPGQCDLFLENETGGLATFAQEQLDCCLEPHQLICDGECTSYLTDASNCGGCGNVCASDEMCSNGVCVCNPGLTECGAGCVDLQTDPTNCGSCDTTCTSDEHCGDGACLCNPGLTECGAGCIDLLTDSSNCGACGTVCPVGGFCSNGGCACPAGQTSCGGVCVDLSADPSNCGVCGNVCGSNSVCASGVCKTCRPPQGTACNNQCVNLHTDPFNCGACGNVCDFSGCPSEGQGTCSQGTSCVCDPAPAVSSGSALTKPIRFKPIRRQTLIDTGSRARASHRSAQLKGKGLCRTTKANRLAASPGGNAALSVTEAPVCDLPPIETVIPSGGTYTQSSTGGRFGKEIQTTVSIAVNGRTIAQGPCPQVVPVTGVDTSGVILSPVSVATRDTSGDGLCQPGEAQCDFFIGVTDVGDSPCVNPVATLSSPPDPLNLNPIVFLSATSSYPSFPGYPGDGQPLERKTNTTAFSISTQSDQLPDVGRPFLMTVSCANMPSPVLMPITLGIGSACVPADIDGKTYDSLNGFQSPVRARLVPEGSPVNFSTGNFNHGSTIPLKLTLACGGQVLSDADIEPNPKVVGLVHTTLGPQSLIGINGDNNANPDYPGFSCSTSSCDYQFRTVQLPVGTYIISIQMPDTRVFRAGFTISP